MYWRRSPRLQEFRAKKKNLLDFQHQSLHGSYALEHQNFLEVDIYLV